MITRWLGERLDPAFTRLLALAARWGVTPNMLTVTGLVINAVAAVFFARGWIFSGGVLVLFANIFDVLDGQMARRTGQATRFGAFFDSVVDRYSDLMLLLGLTFYYTRLGERLILFILGFALIGSIMTSYTRARAECIIRSCRVGFFERPERIAVITLGALFNRMTTALFLLAVFSNVTVIQRIVHTHERIRALENRPRGMEPEAAPEEEA